jgi:hypothetical protein
MRREDWGEGVGVPAGACRRVRWRTLGGGGRREREDSARAREQEETAPQVLCQGTRPARELGPHLAYMLVERSGPIPKEKKGNGP